VLRAPAEIPGDLGIRQADQEIPVTRL